MRLSNIYQLVILSKFIPLIILLVIVPKLVLAGGDDVTVVQGGDATEMTQLLNNALLKENSMYQERSVANSAQSLIHQAEMVSHKLKALNDMAQNSKSVSNGAWSKTGDLLKNLAKVVSSGQALSYASQNSDERFKNQYPGYRNNKNYNNYSQDYRNWSDSSMDSIRGSLNSSNLQANDFANEDQLISQLSNMSQTSTGRMQATQTGNMIAIEQVQQLRKLRQLQMAQSHAQNNYLASQAQDSIDKRANQDNFFDVSNNSKKSRKGFIGGSNR